MGFRDELRKTLIADEGLELKLYNCSSNKTSIGVGRNLEDRGISHETAMQMLEEDIDIVEHELDENLSYYKDLPEKIRLALCNLCFNMGISRLLQFKKTLQYLRDEEYEKASEELLDSRYASQLPNRSKRVAEMIKSAEE